jgi:hypothetical protein
MYEFVIQGFVSTPVLSTIRPIVDYHAAARLYHEVALELKALLMNLVWFYAL